MSETRWLDTYKGAVWRYESPLRPIIQLPLERLSQVLDPGNIGPDVRILITARELDEVEIAAFELVRLDGRQRV